jgi:hypothetical protein
MQASDFLNPNWFSPQATPQPGQPPQGQRMTPQQAMVQRRMAMQLAQQNPTAGAKVGPYQVQNGWTAAADALRMGMAGLLARNANTAELGNMAAGAAAVPGLGNPGPAQPAMAAGESAAAGAAGADNAVAGAAGGAMSPPIDRSAFWQELTQNPALRDHILAIGAGENMDDRANVGVYESLMNRAAMMGTSLSQEARLARDGGYYAGYNPAALKDPATRQRLNTNLELALSGTNITHYATDNASGDFAKSRAASGMYTPVTMENGEMFSFPSRSDARGADRYAQWKQSVSPAQPGAGQPQGAQGQGGASVPPAAGVLPALPKDENIQQMFHAAMMTGNEQLMEQARTLYQQKWNALQPQTVKTPDGRTLIGNPYTGWKDSGLPAMPTVERYPYEVGGIKGESPLIPTYQSGQFGYSQVPITGPGGQPLNQGGASQTTGTSGAAYEPFPVNGSIADKAAWAERQQGRLAATKKAAETSGGVQGQIDEEAEHALGLKTNLQEMRNLGQNINFNRFAETKAYAGNVLQSLGFSNEAVTNLLGTNPGDVEGFRKAATVLAGQATSSTFPRATQNEFQIFLRNATPNELLSPQGMSRVMDFAEKGANIALDKQAQFQQWKQGRSPDTYNDFGAAWNKLQREKIEAGAYTTQPGAVGGPAASRRPQLPNGDPLNLFGGR